MSLKIWSDWKYGRQFGRHVERHCYRGLQRISWCLRWFGGVSAAVLTSCKLSHERAPHWFQPRRDKKTTIRVSLSLLSQTCRHPYSTSLCRFPVSSQVLRLKLTSTHIMWLPADKATSENDALWICIATVERLQFAQKPPTLHIYAFLTVLQFALGKSSSKKVHYEHIFITWTLQSRRFLPSEISARLCGRRREYLHRWKTNFANTLVL